jgi:hypothetical protein
MTPIHALLAFTAWTLLLVALVFLYRGLRFMQGTVAGAPVWHGQSGRVCARQLLGGPTGPDGLHAQPVAEVSTVRTDLAGGALVQAHGQASRYSLAQLFALGQVVFRNVFGGGNRLWCLGLCANNQRFSHFLHAPAGQNAL